IDLPLHLFFEAPTIAELAKRLEAAGDAGQTEMGQVGRASVIVPVSRDKPLPLSFAQQRLWFLALLEPENPFYNMPMALRLPGALDLRILERTLNEIVRRHESLRTTFTTREGQPVQVIASPQVFAISLVDLSHLPQGAAEQQAKRLAAAEAKRPFRLEQETPIRITVIKLNDADHVLLFTLHHIASDGWSLGVLTKEVGALYEAYRCGDISPLPELPIQYADFAHWQRQWLQGEVLKKQLDYWQDRLAGAPALLELPTDFPRPALQTYKGASHWFALDETLTAGLRQIAQHNDATLYMVLLAAFDVLLARYAGQTDILVGTAIANRNRAEIENLIGVFANTLVMRNDLSGNPRFTDLVAQVREVAMGAYAHQDLPFEHLVEVLNPERSLSYSPLFQVMFILQNTPMGSLQLPGLQVKQADTAQNQTAKCDLLFQIVEQDKRLSANLEYNTDLFRADTVARMAEHFEALVRTIVEDSARRLSELSLLSGDAYRQIVVEWNDTTKAYPREQCFHEIFEQQATRTPQAIAIASDSASLTYAELNDRANRLAHYLRGEGVGPDKTVGLCVERSFDMMIGLMAILKAGGAYVPLDPNHPTERLAYFLNDAKPSLLVTQQSLLEKIPPCGAPIFCIDRDWPHVSQRCDNPGRMASSANLAYVIYTSGSTGRPKGVAVTHGSIAAFVAWARPLYDAKDLEGVLFSTSISFDLSGFELFATLGLGGSLLLV
ncbi:MAG TPA: condensation domain-containing protein, partial [Rhodocyclaceae bacterium]|nr:condensation domain-containing protein [Rhodocyclaceae bacterium]